MNRSLPFYPALLLTLVLGALFWRWPALDLWTAQQFLVEPREFWWTDQPISLWQKRAIRLAGTCAVLGFVLGIVRTRAGGIWRGLPRRGWTFLLVALLLGPGLVVNLGLKDTWGRARPTYVQEFGGPRHYSHPLQPVNECKRNCAFVSGDAALGFFPMAGAFVCPRRRRAWLAAGGLTGGVIGFWRIAAGGHFLSDVLFAGVVVYAVCALLARLLPPTAGAAGVDAVIKRP